MASNSNLLTAQESAQLAGVSTETLRQYATQGFLKLVEKDGEQLFQADEISELFVAGGSGKEEKESTSDSGDNENAGFGAKFSGFSPLKERECATDLHSQIETLKARPFEPSSTIGERINGSTHSELVAVNRQLREEIRILREEKEWLRSRLEKLESRSERDQMLMMSELETIRGLVNQQPARKSWLAALPWFGNR